MKRKAKHLLGKPKEKYSFFAQKMLKLTGLAARNFFVSISFSGFRIKSSTFSSLQEESSASLSSLGVPLVVDPSLPDMGGRGGADLTCAHHKCF